MCSWGGLNLYCFCFRIELWRVEQRSYRSAGMTGWLVGCLAGWLFSLACEMLREVFEILAYQSSECVCVVEMIPGNCDMWVSVCELIVLVGLRFLPPNKYPQRGDQSVSQHSQWTLKYYRLMVSNNRITMWNFSRGGTRLKILFL